MADTSGFLGTGWAFPPAFDARGKQAAMVSAQADVEQSLRILLGTTPGERIMQPGYGCGLRRMVFETLDESRITEIKDLVSRAVLFFEVRIELDAVEVDTSELPQGLLRLRLAYTLRSTNSRHNLVYPLYLNEGSGVGFQA
jgi:phage baseplate assembly protein W